MILSWTASARLGDDTCREDPSTLELDHRVCELLGKESAMLILSGRNVGIPWKHDSADRLDGLLAERVAEVVERGYVDQISMSYDRWFFKPRAKVTELDPEFLNAKVPYSHMFDSFVPRLAKMGVLNDKSMRFLIDTQRRICELTPA